MASSETHRTDLPGRAVARGLALPSPGGASAGSSGVLSDAGAHASAGVGGGLSESLEDYLEIILALSLEQVSVRVRDIARAKGVRMPSVTAALHRLSEKGLVEYEAREHVGLTPAGETIAHRLAGRHRFLTRLLHRLLHVPEEIAERDACGLEHHLSSESLDRLAAFVEYIETCPLVGPDFLRRFQSCFTQPEAGGRCGGGCLGAAQCDKHAAAHRSIHPLHTLPAGANGALVRIKTSGALRDRLMRRGLLPGSRIAKLEGMPGRGASVVQVQGQSIKLTAREAAVVLVELDSEDDGGGSQR